jgi:cytochrome c oxidase subunit 2
MKVMTISTVWRRFYKALVMMGCALAAPMAWALPPMNMPEGVTPMSREIYHLHMAAFWVCVVIGIFTFAALIYSIVKFRRSKGAVSGGVNEHLGVEILWTAIPFLILVALAIPATKVLIMIHDTEKPALNVLITGYQWKWKYDYLDQGISFYSNLSTPQDQIQGTAKKGKWFLLEVDHPMVVPVGEKIRLLVTADDVIHSWWVPDLGVKQDAVPGYVNENWMKIDKPGIYRGQCAELCGVYHGFMPIVVKAVPPAEFKAWVAKHQHAQGVAVGGSKPEKKAEPAKDLSKKELMELGKKGYDKSCALCHQMNGAGLPPTFPAIKNGPISTGPVQAHIDMVLNGKPGTAMQAFKSQLDDKTLAAIITYERNAWGNDKINAKKKQQLVVQPAEIAKAKQ